MLPELARWWVGSHWMVTCGGVAASILLLFYVGWWQSSHDVPLATVKPPQSLFVTAEIMDSDLYTISNLDEALNNQENTLWSEDNSNN